jgi:murein L,D-transpeptidase YafK
MPASPEYRVVVSKSARRLRLYLGETLAAEYPVSIGRSSAADKSVEGDEATPLGDFYICAKNPRSKHFLSLCLSYPNAAHAERGLRAGLISKDEHAEILAAIAARRLPPQKTRLGGEIYIHGGRLEHGDRGTQGCVAVANETMQTLFDQLPLGTAVAIEP